MEKTGLTSMAFCSVGPLSEKFSSMSSSRILTTAIIPAFSTQEWAYQHKEKHDNVNLDKDKCGGLRTLFETVKGITDINFHGCEEIFPENWHSCNANQSGK